jgi:homoserine dehydrogenase
MPRIIRTALAGLGAVNRNWLALLTKKESTLADRYDLAFQIVAAADSSGAAYCPDGFAPADLVAQKLKGGRIADLSAVDAGCSFTDLLHPNYCDLVLEATPVNLKTGEPGLSITRTALQNGVSAVLANKGPLVLDFHALTQLSRESGAGLAYSATVCGALPVINIGQRDLVAADIQLMRGIFNSTTNFILAEMARGASFTTALAEAQRRGIAETDPSLDIDGWDTANKLVIIANSILNLAVSLQDVAVTGIREVTTAQLSAALAQGNTIKLVATLQKSATGYQFAVAPMVVAQTDFLGSCSGWEMGIEIHSDLYGRLYHKIWEESPIPTAAAMLRDAVNLFAVSKE